MDGEGTGRVHAVGQAGRLAIISFQFHSVEGELILKKRFEMY